MNRPARRCYAISMSRLHIIYVPGLGDSKPHAQQFIPGYWGLFGVTGYYLPIRWSSGAFAPKLERLIGKIDELAAKGDRVSLVGTSAGASAVLVAYAARPDKVAGVVCICGKINHPETVEPWRFAENPAFKESLAQLQQVLPALDRAARARIMSIHPWYDDLVPVADTRIPGATEKTIPAIGHVFGIFVALVFCTPIIIKFLKRQTK